MDNNSLKKPIPPDDITRPLREEIMAHALSTAELAKLNAKHESTDKTAMGDAPPAGGSASSAEKLTDVTVILPVQTPAAKVVSAPEGLPAAPKAAPWTLQQFFNGEIDLDVELGKRFPNMPVMSSINFRGLGTKTGRGVATLTTTDARASVIVDADAATRVVQLSFTYGSMLTLRFTLESLSEMDRARWLELMRREQGGLAFLWGANRWENDYLICISRKYFTNLYAFSPNNFDSAIRMTPEVGKKLLDWLEEFWKTPPPEEEPPKLLTW